MCYTYSTSTTCLMGCKIAQASKALLSLKLLIKLDESFGEWHQILPSSMAHNSLLISKSKVVCKC